MFSTQHHDNLCVAKCRWQHTTEGLSCNYHDFAAYTPPSHPSAVFFRQRGSLTLRLLSSFLSQGKLFCHYLTKCLILRKSLFKSQIKFACANNPSNTYDTSISTIYRKGKSLQPNVWMGKFSRHRLSSTSYVHTSNPMKSNLFGESLRSEPKCGVSL